MKNCKIYAGLLWLCLLACSYALPDKLQAQTPLLYGVRFEGGTYNDGTIISFNTVSNTETVVWNFGSVASDGAFPQNGLVYDSSNGLFYISTSQGGAYGYGAIVSFDPRNNTEHPLYSFTSGACFSQPTNPGDLVYNPRNGLYYGMLPAEGPDNCAGVIFNFNPANNTVNQVYDFDSQNDTDGVPVSGKLVYYSGTGIFYAMTYHGGSHSDAGAIISYNPLSYPYENVLWSFGADSDGNSPNGSFVYDTTTGLLYGMTFYGGTNNKGTIISFNPANNTENVVWHFGSDSDGAWPNRDLVLDPDNGLYYATTTQGGSNNAGAIISFNPLNNTEKVVWSLTNQAYGKYLEGNLVYDQANRLFYATPGIDDGGDDGTIISFNPANNTVNLLYTFNDGPNSGPGTGLVLYNASGACNASLTITADTSTAMLIHTVGQAGGTPPFTYSWTWGDGSGATSGPSASHTYNTAGYYNVCLTITDSAGCTGTNCDTSYNIKSCLAHFTVSADTSVAYTVNTLSQSTGVPPVTYTWTWGDGNNGNGPGTASHTYSNYGFYDICLLVTDSTGCTGTWCDTSYYIKSCFSHFTVQPDTGTAYSIYTLNQSAGVPPVTYTWTWGDTSSPTAGYTGSHTYSAPGYYDVCLTVTDSTGCTAAWCNSNVDIKTCFAHYTLYPDTSVPHHWYALSQAIGVPPIIYTWNWGDGSGTSTGDTASHTYSAPAYYNICLTITDSTGCMDTYCDSSTYIRQAGDTLVTVNGVIQLPVPTGIYATKAGAALISVYPNPANNTIIITGLSKGQIISLYNCEGQMLIHVVAHNASQVLDISALANGLYMLHLSNGGAAETVKIVKE